MKKVITGKLKTDTKQFINLISTLLFTLLQTELFHQKYLQKDG